MTVSTAQRFTREHPCPVCGGYANLPQGAGTRCWGFVSDDGMFCHCTRPEGAGNLDQHRDGTYVHRLIGECRCGVRHDSAPPPPPTSTHHTNGDHRRAVLTLDALAAYYGLTSDELCKREVEQHGEGVAFRSAAGLHIRCRIEKDGEGSRWVWRLRRGKALFGASALASMRAVSDRIMINESEIDAIVCRVLGFPAVAVAGNTGWDAAFWADLTPFTTVIVWREDAESDVLIRKMVETRPPNGPMLLVASSPDDAAKDAGRLLRAHGRATTRALILGALDESAPVEAGSASTSAAEPEPTSHTPAAPAWPEPPDPAAFYGLAGEIVNALDPATEADRVALLVDLLAAVGNAVGNKPYWAVGTARQPVNIFAVLVGPTSTGRKGTSRAALASTLNTADPHWFAHCQASGISSGEGLIWAVRDPIVKTEPMKEKGQITGYQDVTVDAGVSDKRLMVVEPEFASVLRVMRRDGSTTRDIIRHAWDNGDLRTLTKNSPARATGAHITLLGHITPDELRRELDALDASNGFANRFIWVCVRRSKLLPDGGTVDHAALDTLAHRLGATLDAARDIGRLSRDPEAAAMWRTVYPALSRDRPGLAGAILSRAEAQVMRLACLYALLDASAMIRPGHLRAALALWEYAERSTTYVFGDATGDSVADTILTALRGSGPLSRNDLYELLGRHVNRTRTSLALSMLATNGLARSYREETGGRPREMWKAA